MCSRLNLEDIPINTLPREARLVLTLFGRTQRTEEQLQAEAQQNNKEGEENGDIQFEQVELGWTAIQLFDYDGYDHL